MQKSDLISIVKKYFLEGSTQSVKWQIKDKNLTIDFKTDDKSILGQISYNLDLPDCEFGIFDAASFISFLGALDEDIQINYHYERNKLIGLDLSDKVINATFMLADLSILDAVTGLKREPEWDCEIKLKKENIDRIIKSKKSLNDAKLVAFEPFQDLSNPNAEKVELIINYSTHNTNRINLQVDANILNSFSLVAFNVDMLTKILSANLQFKEAILKLSGQGLLMVEFKDEDYESRYYLHKIKTDE